MDREQKQSHATLLSGAALPNIFGALSPDAWHTLGTIWPVLLVLLGVCILLTFLKILTRLIVLIMLVVLFAAMLLWGLVHTDSPLVKGLPDPLISIIRTI